MTQLKKSKSSQVIQLYKGTVMGKEIILVRYAEIHLKGKNRGYFERLLKNNIMSKISKYNAQIEVTSGRYIVFGYAPRDSKKIQNLLLKTAGVYSISVGKEIDATPEAIRDFAVSQMSELSGTFRVSTTRADKSFPFTSMEYSAKIGGEILKTNHSLKVDLHNPTHHLNIDIRANKKAYIYFNEQLGINGMPVSSSGKGLLLLSGGIDSPVAGFMMCKRGMKLSAIHFESFPYTSPQAKEKAISLAKVLAEYNGEMNLYVVNIASIQDAIHENCHPDFMITLVRRFMLRIAQRIAHQNKLQAIVTGESLGQVASQTIESMSVIGSVLSSDLPLLKPLVGFDKQETVEIAKKIGSFEISIKPYDDCCTVFLPKSPVIKPKMKEVLFQERKLDVDALVDGVMESIEKIRIE